jgi:tetratricopeptide (TPR) repeat protein/MinD-like ATPase involved in chromosome partitioning or flagellar assembly
VYTFYSYKGGVGRTMALANVGALLAQSHRVLLVDWDLEAPGLEQYFRCEPSTLHGSRREKGGVVDLVEGYCRGQKLAWRDCLLTASPFGRGERLSILTAGRESDDYVRRVQTLDWPRLFDECNLGWYLEELRREWTLEFDFILLDSRTGITDIGGICTILFPDVLVLLFTTGRQSLDGVIDVMRRARKAQADLVVDRSRLLGIPVPSRDESRTENALAAEWRATFAERLAFIYEDWLPKGVQPEDVLQKLRIPNVPYWSFGEPLPVVREGTRDPQSIGFAFDLLACLLRSRLDWEKALSFQAVQFEPARVYISYSHDSPDHEAKVLALANRLREDGVDAVLDQYESFPSEGWEMWQQRQIQTARFVVMVCTATYQRRFDAQEELGRGLGTTSEAAFIRQLLYDAGGNNEKFVPVLLTDAGRAHIPLGLQRYQHYAVYTARGYEDLYRLMMGQPPSPGPSRALPAQERKPDYLYWNLPPRNPFFTGRDPYLKRLEDGLACGRAQAISGLGGIGKTQTAIEYAYRHRDQYRAVLWSGADSRDALVSGFGAIASLLDLPEKDERDANVAAEAVRRWLERQPGWLLILDNVEDLAGVVKPFLPTSGTGHVLITTRLQATGAVAQSEELERMELEEGTLFLLRRAKLVAPDAPLDAASEADRKAAMEITEEVAGLPLALDQAAAYIQETPSSLAKYLKLYRTEGAALRAQRGKLATDHDSVTITFSLAFAEAAQANQAAADLVRACAHLACDPIPEEIFTQGGRELGEPLSQATAKPLAWDAAVEAAGRFALIRRNVERDTLEMHRLVQEVLKDGMDAPTRRVWAERVVQALNDVFPSPEFRNWPQCERLIPHAIAAARLVEDFGLDSVAAARLLNRSGTYLDDRARYMEAEPLYQRALAIHERAQGPDHPDTAMSLNNLALLYDNQGRYGEAEPLYHRALAIDEYTLGPDSANTASDLNNLASLYTSQGRYGEAEPLYQRALAIKEKALGPDHPSTAASLHNLAGIYYSQGRYGEAEPLYQRALAIDEKALGPDHPNTATDLNNLAGFYHNQGRYAEAEPLYQRALAIYEKALGPDHPHTVQGVRNYALFLRERGRAAEAEKLEARFKASGR